MFTGLKRRHRDRHVGIARGTHINDVDVVAVDDRAPIYGSLGKPEPGGFLFDRRSVASTEDRQHGDRTEVEGHARCPPSVGVSGAHEAVADHRHP